MEYKHLHHVDLPNHYQFITFRTHDSVDSYIKKILSSSIQENKKQQNIDDYLDSSTKGAYLKKQVLNWLYKFIQQKDNDIYKLIAFSIMPNHIHLLFKPLMGLPVVIKNIKGPSAFAINKMLNRKGTFWNDSYFDKLIRDEKHFNVVYNYIKNNPRNITKSKDELPRFYGIYE